MEMIMNRSLIASIAALGVIAAPAMAATKAARPVAQKTQVKTSAKVAAKAPVKPNKRRG
jgi:hypothetical protein